MFRAVTRFAIAVLIGVGATLGWQAYGDTAKQMLAAHAPELAWALAYIPATKPVAAAAPANAPLQLEPLASSIDVVRRSVEQLALKQEQMARNIAAMQAVDEDIRQKVSSPPPAAAQPAAAVAAAQARAAQDTIGDATGDTTGSRAIIAGASPVACARTALARARALSCNSAIQSALARSGSCRTAAAAG